MICNNCGALFDTPSKAHESLLGYPIEEDVCPECGNENIEYSKSCPLCGEQMAETKDYCDNCTKVIEEAKEMVVDIFKKETGLSYRESINVLVEFLEKEL